MVEDGLPENVCDEDLKVVATSAQTRGNTARGIVTTFADPCEHGLNTQTKRTALRPSL